MNPNLPRFEHMLRSRTTRNHDCAPSSKPSRLDFNIILYCCRLVPLVDRSILQRLADLEVSPDPDERPSFTSKPAAAATHGDEHPGSRETPGSVSCSRYLQYPWNALLLSTLPPNRRAGVEGPCRLREKFLGQEGVGLSDSFSLAYMIPAAPGKGRRTRSNSLSSASAFSDAALEKIASEEYWARLRASLDGAKVTLRFADIYS
ncbi:hypothetical protein B0H14DRAFT_3890118 [Mycena olivaceomarginata]|nr:hypothetical protein B0H14DRAFT_3890118 [Mycena olivaceomarginata]